MATRRKRKDSGRGTAPTPFAGHPRKPVRKPGRRHTTHKKRTIWFRARAAWPARDANVGRLLRARRTGVKRSASPNWTQAGPTHIGGRATALVCDPRDPERIWLGAAGGGVWFSADGGRSWTAQWHREPSLNIGALAIDPSNADVLYAATGEANLSADSYAGVGVYKSGDGGRHWKRVASAEKRALPRRIGALAVDPFDPLHVRLGGVRHDDGEAAGHFFSRDGGLTWARDATLTPDDTFCHAVLFHPKRRGTLFATLDERGARNGIWRSTDGGVRWVQLARGLPAPDLMARASLALAPSRPDVLYALIADRSDGVLGVFRSTDAGARWTRIDHARLRDEGQLSYGNTLAVHPTDPDHVLLGGIDLHRTTDAGKRWSTVTRWHAKRGAKDYAHADHHALLMPAARPGLVYSANDGGLDVSENGGTRWANRSAGLAITMFYDLERAASQASFYGGGAQDNGTLATVTGDPADFSELTGGDGGWMVIDPRDADHFYTSSQFMTVYRFRKRWVECEIPEDDGLRPWMAYLAMDPRDTGVVYVGSSRVWRTGNDGRSWRAVSDLLDGSAITALEIAPADSRRLYAGTEDGGVFRSRDGGESWSGNLAGATLPGRTITRLETDPRDADVVYASIGGSGHPHLYRSEDAGGRWNAVGLDELPDAPLHAIAVSARDSDVLFACGDAGVYRSDDRGKHWRNLTGDLPGTLFVDLDYDAVHGELMVATYGRSIWRCAQP